MQLTVARPENVPALLYHEKREAQGLGNWADQGLFAQKRAQHHRRQTIYSQRVHRELGNSQRNVILEIQTAKKTSCQVLRML